jgi:hypothetical protein
MRIALHHRPLSSKPLSRGLLVVGRVRASASGTPSTTSRRERARWHRQSERACRPMDLVGSIAKPMGTFVGLSQNGLDPEVVPA